MATDYTILVKAVLDRANLQSQLNQINGTRPATVRANIQLDPAQIDRQVKLWENALAKMQARAPDAFGSKAVQDQVSAFNQLVSGYKAGTTPIKDVRLGLDNVRTSLTQVSSSMKNTTSDGYSFSNMLEVATRKMLLWSIAGTAIYGTLRQIQNGVQYIRDLDKELTNISVVTGMNQRDVGNLAVEYNKLATSLGATTKELVVGSTEWFRQGKTVKEVNELLVATMTLSKLGNMDSAQATEYLTSTLNGFKLEAKDAMGVIDKLTQLDNNYATSSKELAEALQRSANSADQAGVTFDELNSYIAITSSVTRKSAESIGESYKTMFARLGNIKLGKMFEDDATNINDVEKALGLVNIKLRDSATSFRPVGDIFDEIASKWENMNELEQSAVANAISGVRQRENFLVLMNNYNQVLEAQKIQADSAGLAQQRYAKYLDSVEAATNRLTAAWEKMVANTINSNVLKFFINLGTGLLGVVDTVGILNTVLATLGAYIGILALTAIPQFSGVVATLSVQLGIATGAATALSMALGASIIGIAIIGTIALFKELNKSVVDTYNEFNRLQTVSQDNQKELRDLATEYENLANKQNKTAEDITRLLDIQTILNTRYGASKDGIELYTDAIDKNSLAIQENIAWIKKKADQEAQSFLERNKYLYEEASNLLNKPKKNWLGGDDMLPEEQLRWFDQQIEKTGDISGGLRKARDILFEQVDAARKLVIEYEHYKNLTTGGSATSPSTETAPVSMEGPKKSLEELGKLLDEDISSLSSLNDQMDSLIESYNKYGQVGLDQVAQLRKTFGEDYIQALYTENGQIKLNEEALKSLIIAKAMDAWATANKAYITAIDTGATKENIAALKEQAEILGIYYNQLKDGTTLSVKSAEAQKKAQDDILKMTIDMIKQRKEAEKDALQDQLKAFKDSIDARKDALEKQADAEKQRLQDQLDGYKAIIQAEKDLIDQRAREEEFQDKVGEKNKQISDIDAQLLALQFDNSEEAKAKRLQLEDEKTKVLKELGKIQKDNTIENQKEALDKEIEGYEKGIKAKQTIIERNLASQKEALDQEYKDFEANINAKIAKIEEYLKQSGTITSDAMALMSTKTDAFYQSLLDWNQKYGTSVQKNIIDLLNEAFGIQLMLNSMGGFGGGTYGGGNTGGGGTGPIGTPGYNYYNPPEYHHSGADSGFVGQLPKLKSNEQFAVLMKGEGVFKPNQMDNFMKNVLPNIAGANGGDTNIELNLNVAGSLDKSVLPDLKETVLNAVNTALSNRGTRRNAFSFSGG